MDTLKRLTPQQFFDMGIEGGTMTAAQLATGIAYSTIHRTKTHGASAVETAKALAKWSRTVPAALAEGVCIGAAEALGLDDDDCPTAPVSPRDSVAGAPV